MILFAFFLISYLSFSFELSHASCFTVRFIVIHSSLILHPFFSQQLQRRPNRGAKTAGGKMAGDAEQLGQVYGQETQEGLSY